MKTVPRYDLSGVIVKVGTTYDLAGVVVKVGTKVKDFKEGNEVYWDTHKKALDDPKQFGSITKYIVVEKKLWAFKPKNLDFSQAVAFPLIFYEGFEKTSSSASKSIIVLNGASEVGSLVIQVKTSYTYKKRKKKKRTTTKNKSNF